MLSSLYWFAGARVPLQYEAFEDTHPYKLTVVTPLR